MTKNEHLMIADVNRSCKGGEKMSKRGMRPETAKKIREAKGIEDTKLQKIRVQRGLSQKDLSVISGVSKRSIQCYEQRTRDIDSAHINTLCGLALALNCKIEDVIESQELIDRFRLAK